MSSLRPGLEPPSGQHSSRLRRTEAYSQGSSQNQQNPQNSQGTSQIPSRIRMPSKDLDTPRTRPAPMQMSYSNSSAPSGSSSGSSNHSSTSYPSGRSVSSSKIPQTSSGAIPVPTSQRRPSDARDVRDARDTRDPRLRSHSRPPLTHQSQSWGVTTSISDSTAGTFASSASTTSSSRSASSMISPPSSAPRLPRSTPNNLATRTQRTQIPSQIPAQTTQTTQRQIRSRNNSGETSSSSSATRAHTPLEFDRTLTDSPAELRVAKKAEVTSAQTVMIYPELDRYRSLEPSPSLSTSMSTPMSDSYGPVHPDMLFRLATESTQAPPTPYFSGSASQVSSGISASPSTRFSESPGPGSYSRDTTPTSMSSQSPGILSSGSGSGRIPSAPRMRQPVRVRAGSFGSYAKDSAGTYTQGSSVPPTQTLAAIRESLNSSSSSSNGTIRGDKSGDKREKLKKKRLSPTPPSPPPRKSSTRFKESGDEMSSPEKSRPSSSKSSSSRAKASAPSPVPAMPKTHRDNATASTGSPRPLQRPVPPSRPSRDGTPDLQWQLGFPHPIIQSNLSHAPSSDHLGISHATPPQPATVQLERQLAPSALPSSRRNESSQSLQSQIPSKADDGSRSSREQGRTTRTPSPNVSTFRTRFPLFGRRTKTAPGTVDTVSAAGGDKKDGASARKGPVAGTGHEGYGRMGSNRRRSSSVSTFLRGTLSSQESLSSPQSQDPFLRDRMSPVVIAGGEIIENKNIGYDLSRTGSNTSGSVSVSAHPGYPRPSTDSLSSREDRTTLWPSALPRGANRSDISDRSDVSNRSRRPSDSSDSEAAMRSTLAYRRSVQRLQSPDRAQVRVPRPIVVRSARPGMPPSIDSVTSINSLDTSIMTDDSSAPYAPSLAQSTQSELLRGRRDKNSQLRAAPPSTTTTRKLTKRQRSPRRWNLFGRSQSQPATSKRALQSTSTVAVTVEAINAPEKAKPVAFYAMIDSSEPEDGDGELGDYENKGEINVEDVENILHLARMPDSPASTSASFGKVHRNGRPSIEQVRIGNEAPTRPARDGPAPQEQHRQQYRQPDLALHHYNSQVSCPPQPQHVQQFQPQPQQVQQPQETQRKAPDTALPMAPMMRSGRPSRLAQVGRIPKVVSARPDTTSPKSFSRPFNRISAQLSSAASTPQVSMDTDSIAKGPTPPGSATPDLMHDGSTVTHNLVPTPEVGFIGNGAEFFTMASRKDSHTTSGTSSSGVYSFADATAIVPSPSAPLAEDEIWDEYNDLLEDRPTKGRASTTSSHGMPFHLEADARSISSPHGVPIPVPVLISALRQPPTAKEASTPALESPTVITFPSQSIDETLRNGRPPVASSIYSTDIVIANADDIVDQRVSSASQPPATPFSVSEFVSGYGDRNNSVGKAKKTTTPAAQRNSSSSSRSLTKKPRASDGSAYSQVSEDNSPISQVNLRVGSMTVSKWLTFGHVLFSPARDNMVLKVSPPNGHSVLVIDGLGNDDWSFYAAETYPAATFFNLSPRAPLPVDPNGNAPTFPMTPPNHHQIQYLSNGDKLPFQAEIFTTVVYRFPTAAPESHYRNVINEARRVLKPGGYLELSILDMDLNNMGPRTRRAIRRLKEQTHTHTPDMYLGSTADVILRLLGTRGFTDVKSCRVGIPAASPIPRSGSDSSVSGESKLKTGKKTKSKTKTVKDQRSLAEMINDESPVADESITNMVARVGRWWHSRCYGDAALDPATATKPSTTASGTTSSMWMDRALLAECEEWRTNLKLTVCYARAPDIKRVASI